jgi:hypothetical protein
MRRGVLTEDEVLRRVIDVEARLEPGVDEGGENPLCRPCIEEMADEVRP